MNITLRKRLQEVCYDEAGFNWRTPYWTPDLQAIVSKSNKLRGKRIGY